MKRLLLCLALCVVSTPAFATQVQEVVSPGGIKAWLVEEHSLPLIAVKMIFKDSGAAYDLPSALGRAAMTSSLLVEGAGDLDSQAFNEALESHAIELSFGVDEDRFRASMETLSEEKETAFSLMGLALVHPRFDESALVRIKSQTLAALVQKEQDPGYKLHRGWQQLAFANHPYSAPRIGTKESITAFNAKTAKDYTHRYLTRENLLIAVVGDITPAALGALLDKHLGKLPTQYAADSKIADTRLTEQPQQVIIEHDIPQTMIAFGMNGVKREDPDFYTAFVMNQVLGGNGLTSRLGTEIREKRGLAYSVSSDLDPMTHAAGWGGGFSTRNEKMGEALTALRETLAAFAKDGPTDKEMEDAKRYLTGSFVLNLDSNGDIANYLINMQLNKLGMDYLDKRNAIINAVTKEEVKAVAAKLTDPAHLLVVMVGKPGLKP